MKKLLSLFAALMLVVSTTVVNAQATQSKTRTAAHVKKDGTADKRFKDNKTIAPAGPTKKDGTPDMRYKANKAAPAGPAKKDGTPDMRYNTNKKNMPTKKPVQ